MRSLVIILVTLGALLLGFLIYEFSQPSLAPLNNEPHDEVVATQPVATDNHMGIGPGEGVWIERHDPNTGTMTERFKGNHYDWNPDGTMKVTTPQAEFFLSEGRIMRINGVRGNVVVEEGGPPGKNGGITMTQPAAPTRGNMKDVTIRLFESENAPKPTLVVTMDNATFDTQINRIYTESAIIDGKNIAADRIPVHMRGEDEDFDGWGLRIRWDQKQNTLQLLQIDHGKQLIIKHPNSTEKTGHAPAKIASTEPPAALPLQRQGSSPVPPPSKPTIQIYRASFQNNVHVTQAGKELANSNEMQVDFASEQSNPTDASPTSVPPSPSVPVNSTASKPSTNKHPTTHPTKSSPLGDEPILITWTGKLVVTPFNEPGPLHADPHGQVVTFLGAPAIVRQKGTQVIAANLAYGTTQEELLANGTPAAPVIMTGSDGARVVTQTIDYLRHDERAKLTGAGQVMRPLKATAQNKASTMTAQWSQSCDLTFFGDDEHDLSIHTADLRGAVKIDHPQVKLTGEELTLAFDPPIVANQQPDLDHLHSIGNVDAIVNDSHGKSQAIQCQTLDLSTAPTGQLQEHQPSRYISRLLADGQVWAHEPDSEIRAQHLDAAMVPSATTQPTSDQPLAAVQLKHLIATTDVHVRSKNNASADADNLDVTMDGGQASTVILTGSPARAQKGQDITVGNLIKLHPKDGLYDIPGNGTMHLSRQGEDNSPPTDVWWQAGLHADLNKNAIDIDRGVIVKTTSTEQAHNTATSDHLHITLADKPADKIKTTHKAKSDSLFGDADNVDLAGQKEARSLTMLGNVKVQSVRGDDAGHLLTQFNLDSSQLDYAIPEQQMRCPAGQIFFYDGRKTAQPNPATPAQPNNPLGGGSSRGMTAIKYDGSLLYDQNIGHIELHKNVFLRHEPMDKAQSPTELRSQNMTVDLLKTGDKSAPDQMAIRHMHATDHVMFTTKTMQCQADSLDYDPATGIFIVRGSQFVQAVMYDDQGGTTGHFDEMHYNSKTEQIDRMTGFHSAVRRGPVVPTKDLMPPQN
jgi:lipopolysaccharide export system protein LptA